MKTQHTPGPWSFDKDNLGINLEDHVPIDGDGHMAFAQVLLEMEDRNYDHYPNKGKDVELLANARLIAAAPDLLEQLMNAARVIESEYPEDQWNEYGHDKMIAAIRKATGDIDVRDT